MSEPKCWRSSVVTLNIWSQNDKVTTCTCHHPVSMCEIWKLYVENYIKLLCQNQVLTKFSCYLTFDLKMYGYIPLTILHLCIKYESYRMKLTQDTVSEPKCWQSSAVTLTLKCISIFLSPSCICVKIWKFQDEYSFRYRVRTKMLAKVNCDIDLWTSSKWFFLVFDFYYIFGGYFSNYCDVCKYIDSNHH